MIARIRLPETLRGPTLERLERELAAAKGDVLVLEGACRGMDLAAFLDADAAPWLERFAGLIRAIRSVPLPTIAVVDGAVMGGGVGIAAACDVVIASPNTTFALPEALLGLLPGVVVPALLHRMSPHAVHLLAILGRARGADWALSAGLVDEVSADLAKSTGQWAKALGRADARRVVELREWTAAATAAGLDALRQGAERSARVVSEPRVRTRARAFMEGEAPWLR